jgi:hypothetical protein
VKKAPNKVLFCLITGEFRGWAHNPRVMSPTGVIHESHDPVMGPLIKLCGNNLNVFGEVVENS